MNRIPLYALLVEDDEIQARATLATLTAAGFNVTTCYTGSAALNTFRDNEFHLAVVDLVLPDYCGADLIADIRAASFGKKTTIIALTSVQDEDKLSNAIKNGADDVYNKQVGHHVLRAKFQSLAERFANESRTQAKIRELEELIVSNQENLESCSQVKQEQIDRIEGDLISIKAMPANLSDDRIQEIAEKAAAMAVDRMTQEFYKDIGKTFVQKILILLGVALTAFAVGKGWIR